MEALTRHCSLAPVPDQTKLKMIYEVTIGERDEREALEEIVNTLEEEYGMPEYPDATGLYVISNHIGTRSSIEFWKDVLKEGPAFANPELFPWILANSACGFIARHFKITGPNFTYTGPTDVPLYVAGVLENAKAEQERLNLKDIWVIIIH